VVVQFQRVADDQRLAQLCDLAIGMRFLERFFRQLVVRADSVQLEQLLINLVRNAVDHGIETRGKVFIEITQRDDQISVTVTDDGRGIDPSLIDKIFEPGFSTAQKVSTISGRGIGLDVVKTRVEELGGTVNVRSTPGQGASFELTLPISSA